MGLYISLINAYDALAESGATVCPIAHTYMTVHIAVLLNKKGEFLCAKTPDIKGELVRVPCTDESGRRTSGDCPHLLHDNLCYVAPFGAKPGRHEAYISQLEEYTKAKPEDMYAAAIYNYAKNGDILHDLKDIISNLDLEMPLDKANVAFAVYGLDNDGTDLYWTEHYLSTLHKNGICSVTGEPYYIPSAYPACIISPSGKERFFLKDCGVGYVASQKIIHAIQYWTYGAKNEARVKTESYIQDYMRGEETEDELKQWIDKRYPGKWDGFINILKN